MSRGRLFVIMPFGVRQITERTEPHDFDAFYRNVLRPIALEEDWDVVRVDELVAPGAITAQAIQELLSADLVVADLSMPNGNVYYELGVRQSISNNATLLIALKGTSLPFDIAHQRVFFYAAEWGGGRQFQKAYREALHISDSRTWSHSPVRAALEAFGLSSVGPEGDFGDFQREFDVRIARAKNADQLIAVWHWAKAFSSLPTSSLLGLAERLADAQDFENALRVLNAPEALDSSDYEIHRQRGFYYRNLDDFAAAQREFSRAISLNPSDPETLGMLGGTYKRTGHFKDALECYERGAALSPSSLYMRVNQAAMAILTSTDASKRPRAL
jgi:tetratricopeptide (TPR) repeat protein